MNLARGNKIFIKNILLSTILSLFITCSFLVFPFGLVNANFALAQDPGVMLNNPLSPSNNNSVNSGNNSTCVSGKLCNPLEKTAGNDIFKLVSVILDLLLTIASIAIVVYIIWLGAQYVLARGNTDKIKELHGTLMWTIIGTILIFSAKLIMEIMQRTIDQLK